MENKIKIDNLLTSNLHANGYILGFYNMYLEGKITLEQFINVYEHIIDSINDY